MIVAGAPARLVVLALALCGAVAAPAREVAGDFANQLPIPADGTAALVRFTLSADVYRGVADADLADLRVFNGSGEALPFAFYPRAAATAPAQAAIALKVFALPATPAPAGAGGVHVQTDGAGAVVRIDVAGAKPGAAPDQPAGEPPAYLLDAAALRVPIRALDLAVDAASDYSGRVRLEASSDLATWRTLVADAPLLAITHGSERLERRRIEFAPVSAPYYRLAWTGMPSGARLAGAGAQPGARHAEPERQWSEVRGTPGDRPSETRFDAAAHFPADRLRVVLPEANTVVPVEIDSKAHVDDPWRLRARATVYRLNRAEGEITSPAVAIDGGGDRYWRIVVDERGGGLGAGLPQLALGWVPQELVFAARGAPPYELAFGRDRAEPAAIGIAALIPGYRDDAATDAPTVPGANAPETLLQPVRVVLGAAARPVAPPPEPGLAGAWNGRTVALWAVLSAGVALLGAMAWRLQQQMKRKD